MSSRLEFDTFFNRATLEAQTGAGLQPHDWQRELARGEVCRNRLIRIPTGFGKTLGVLLAWLWHAVERRDERWPRRLVICLPMRVLVEQTCEEVCRALNALGLLWDGQSDHDGKVGVHVLMGGVGERSEWYLYPEQFAVLISTQDLALSAALNRGYTVPRARWPVECGLLNQDALWVMDEVQLMDVGMATSAQLQAFRDDDREKGRSVRPCATWWMSATLQPAWLRKSPDTNALTSELPETRIAADQRHGHLWTDVSKPCRVEAVANENALAKLVAQHHVDEGLGRNGPTVIVVNTVERALAVFGLLSKNKTLHDAEVELKLVHSRFRPVDRKRWRAAFLNRDACHAGTNRIIVSTQVIEAGVDLSASLLVTELAPWPSLVQRFGRSARWGGTARVIVADFWHKDDAKAAPYLKHSLDTARRALAYLPDVTPINLEAFEEARPELLETLYPYEPMHLLLRHELEELFDTAPDLSGSDIDISRFIRSGDERDVRVFWVDVPVKQVPRDTVEPSRDSLCPVPFLRAREWLYEGEGNTFKNGKRAWIWDWVNGEWRRAARRDLFPGQTVLISTDSGGYDPTIGWAPQSEQPVMPAASPSVTPAEREAQRADAQEEHEGLSVSSRLGGSPAQYPWQTIAVHGREVGRLAKALARALAPVHADLFDLAGRWHDVGKAHPCFNASIVEPRYGPKRPARCDLAKAPHDAWLPLRQLYPMPDGRRRSGFRHEVASVLALFAVLRRHAPDHAALLGPWRALMHEAGIAPDPWSPSASHPNRAEQEVLDLDADRFNLLAYLVCSHHGKVRVSWHASPADQLAGGVTLSVRGVQEEDSLPALTLASAHGDFDTLPETTLTLAPATAGLNRTTGMGWTERVLDLLDRFGPFTLPWLEALLVAADRRVSRSTDVHDPLIDGPLPVEHGP